MKNQQILKFYDSIADDYDRMISFEKRLDIEEPIFRNLIEKYSIKSALDAGAGTGFHSILLANSGVRITAVDISEKMLSKLEQNVKNHNLTINIVKSDFLKLRLPDSSFNAVFCLGNSLVHLSSITHLKKVIANFATLLKPGGVMILQLLNYDRIMKQKKHVQSIKKTDNNFYIRYYEFHQKQIIFNLLTINSNDLSHSLHSVPIQPIRSSELRNVLKKSGFGKITLYGDLTLKPFSKITSHDLVVIASKVNSQ
jgi:glycine/sarcosine N-methyltransferase